MLLNAVKLYSLYPATCISDGCAHVGSLLIFLVNRTGFSKFWEFEVHEPRIESTNNR